MRLIVRDDDISYFTDPRRLNGLYKGIWEKIPIHLAVVPHLYARQAEIPPGAKPTKDYYWVGENKRLVAYLKKRIAEGKVVIWQHGFTHRDWPGGFELERRDRKRLRDDLRRGKEHLERAFSVTVDTLVAPHDRLSKAAVLAAEDAGFARICRGFAPLPREIRWTDPGYLVSYFHLFLFWLLKGRGARFPRPLLLGNHEETFFYRIEELNAESIPRATALARRGDGFLRVTMHHLGATPAQRWTLRRLVDSS